MILPKKGCNVFFSAYIIVWQLPHNYYTTKLLYLKYEKILGFIFCNGVFGNGSGEGTIYGAL